MRLILGSQSPRRKEILGYFNLPFETKTSDFPEESVPFTGDPRAYAMHLSQEKGNILAADYPEGIIITADTVVYRDGKIYDKPKDPEDAFRELSELVGRWHSVYTAITIKRKNETYSDVEETRVLFNEISPEQIRQYQKSIHCADKAGGYAIQGAGSILVRKIEGCYYNVMGLPIHTLQKLLLCLEIDLWNYLKG